MRINASHHRRAWLAVLFGVSFLTACGTSSERGKGAKAEGNSDTQALMAIFGAPGQAGAQGQPAPAQPATAQTRSAPRSQPQPQPQQTAGAGAADPYAAWDTQRRAGSQGAAPAQANPAPQPTGAGQAVPQGAPNENPIGELPGQTLAPGACGMFLWHRKPRAELVFFGLGEQGVARMSIEGQVVDLATRSTAGRRAFGQPEQQVFRHAGYNIELQVDLGGRSDLIGGTKVEQGRLRVSHARGWSLVMPVAGIIACQPET